MPAEGIICSRTVCQNRATHIHRDTGYAYCLPCARKINSACKDNTVIPITDYNGKRLPKTICSDCGKECDMRWAMGKLGPFCCISFVAKAEEDSNTPNGNSELRELVHEAYLEGMRTMQIIQSRRASDDCDMDETDIENWWQHSKAIFLRDGGDNSTWTPDM